MNTQTAGPGRARGLATRLLAGQSIVLLAGALTAALVATLLGPSIFHQHLLEAGHSENSPEMVHIEMAYRDASLISLGLGLLIALLAALGVTWFLSRRLRRPLTELTLAARELSRGHYSARVPEVGTGTELETLAGAFNVMAARLEGIEDTRRRMLADLAHELRTPITTLIAYHDGLHDGVVQLGPDSQTALSQQTDRLARLAEDIDEVSTAEEGRLSVLPEAVAVSDLLWNAGESVRDRYRDAGVNLAVDTSGATGLTVKVDRQRLGQVLSNLLTNALRHTPAGGFVTVSARRVDDEIDITVTDTGEGIDPGHLPHVFERFYRGDAARSRDNSGSGIGLTISKAIIDAHHGTIKAGSPGPGQGSTFVISLPTAGTT
ncbi:HAMP domain-containing sensor histidine kinase [Arsenicicoccus sp. oral taxon 190]|uniref:HAMP domain-containing sensor histidine kinase n=1 Tax=Arsenicicoccus sp. oral taxon 190 TaxID=1658671 RepID=UPI00067A214A|nr:ATP-binding protein [Arsenicicoccus sp. oral taxon 190]AKT50724.1 histidine kinase [Arsenicicoccus sp. oral taxon 190]